MKLFNILTSAFEVLLTSCLSLQNHCWIQYKVFKGNSGRSIQTIMCKRLGHQTVEGKDNLGRILVWNPLSLGSVNSLLENPSAMCAKNAIK